MLLMQRTTQQPASEALACDFLEQQGFYVPIKGVTIVDEQNNPLGEIDAIASYQGNSYIVEVKTMTNSAPSIKSIFARLLRATTQLRRLVKMLGKISTYDVQGVIVVMQCRNVDKHYWHLSAYDLNLKEVTLPFTGCHQTTTAKCA